MAGRVYELGNQGRLPPVSGLYYIRARRKQNIAITFCERRDSLIPIDERSFKGALLHSPAMVDKAYDKLTETLGDNWQKEYIVWDMCCGVGNFEIKAQQPTKYYI